MLIRGLTDRGMSFPEIGRIRKGAPKTEKRPGPDLTYFRVVFDEREVDAIEAFARAYPEEPRELNVLLPFADVTSNWDAWYEAHLAGSMVHRCDGHRVWYELDLKTGEPSVRNGKPEKYHDPAVPIFTYKPRGSQEVKEVHCTRVGRLRVIIPELKRLAFLTFITHSFYDILNITEQLNALHSFQGELTGIPLVLKRRPVQISWPSGKGVTKRTRSERWLVSIEANPQWTALKLDAVQRERITMLQLQPRELMAPQGAPTNGDEPEVDETEWPEDDWELTDTMASSEPGEPPEPPEPQEISDYLQAFWELVFKRLRLDREQGREVLAKHEGDAEAAYNYLLAHHTPPGE